MALTIRDAETDALVRRYATLKGVSLTQAVKTAISEAIEREPRNDDSDFMERVRQIQEVFKPFAGTPVDADAIIGYNEYGVPE